VTRARVFFPPFSARNTQAVARNSAKQRATARGDEGKVARVDKLLDVVLVLTVAWIGWCLWLVWRGPRTR